MLELPGTLSTALEYAFFVDLIKKVDYRYILNNSCFFFATTDFILLVLLGKNTVKYIAL